MAPFPLACGLLGVRWRTLYASWLQGYTPATMARIPAARQREIFPQLGPLMGAISRLGAAAWVEGTVEQPTKEMLRMRSAQLIGCDY